MPRGAAFAGAAALLVAASGCERPAPVGPLLFVRDAGGRSAVMWAAAGPAEALPQPVRVAVAAAHSFSAPAGPAGAPPLLIASNDGPEGHEERLWIIDPDKGPRPVGPGYVRLRNPAWTADGRAVVVEAAISGFSDLVRVTLESEEHRPLTELPSGAFTPTVAPDGLVVFVSATEGDLDLYSVPATGGPIRNLLRATGEDLNPTWSPDGERLAWIAARGGGLGLSVMDRADWAPRSLWTATGQQEVVPDQGLGWSPDGALVAAPIRFDNNACIAIFEVSTGEMLRGPGGASPCAAGVEQGLAWAPDGRGLITSRSVSGDADLVLIPARGGAPTTLVGGPTADWLPRWLSPAVRP